MSFKIKEEDMLKKIGINIDTGQVRKKRFYHEYSFPTEGQVRAIRFITMFTGEIFKGKTKDEARIFIDENLEEASKQESRYEWV